MKKRILLLLLMLSLSMFAFGFNVEVAHCASLPKVDWALLIAGTNRTRIPIEEGYLYWPEALYDTYYVYYVLTRDLQVPKDHIKFLYIDPAGASSEIPEDVAVEQCNSTTVKWAIRAWLAEQAGPEDNVLLYVCTHGGGWYPELKSIGPAARVEINGDEGNEVHESTCDKDVNNDGDKTDWFGVDEGIELSWTYDTGGHGEEYLYDDFSPYIFGLLTVSR